MRFVETSSLPLVDLVINFCCRETCEKTMLSREAFEAFEKSLFTIYRMDEYGKTRLEGVTNIFVELPTLTSLDASYYEILLVRSEYSTF